MKDRILQLLDRIGVTPWQITYGVMLVLYAAFGLDFAVRLVDGNPAAPLSASAMLLTAMLAAALSDLRGAYELIRLHEARSEAQQALIDMLLKGEINDALRSALGFAETSSQDSGQPTSLH